MSGNERKGLKNRKKPLYPPFPWRPFFISYTCAINPSGLNKFLGSYQAHKQSCDFEFRPKQFSEQKNQTFFSFSDHKRISLDKNEKSFSNFHVFANNESLFLAMFGGV